MLNQFAADPSGITLGAAQPRRQASVALQSTAVDRTVELPGSRRVRCRLSGESSSPLAIVLGGISADRQIDRWWPDVTGTEGALSPDRFRRLSIDWPVTEDGATVAVDDFADALAEVLDAMHIARVPVFVGASFGAMVGLAFASRHPDRLGRLIAISGAHRSTPRRPPGG